MASEGDIREFELLVETNVKPLVVRRRNELSRARTTRESIEQLQLQLELMARLSNAAAENANAETLKTLVDVGAGFKMHCRAPIPQRVSVDVGCGIFVDMSVEEAHAYCANRLTSLSQLIGVLESELLKTGTDLAIAESGLRELHRAAQAEASEGAGTVQ